MRKYSVLRGVAIVIVVGSAVLFVVVFSGSMMG